MSGSSDPPRSFEEGNWSTTAASSSFGQLTYLPFRQSTWLSGQSDPFAGRSAQRGLPGGNELPQVRPPFEGYGVDPQSPIIHIDHRTRPTSFPSPILPEPNQSFGSEWLRSAPDQPSTFGTRLQDQESHGYSSEAHSTYQALEHENSIQVADTPGSSRTRYTRPRPAYNRDEFDGPAQYLPLPLPQQQQSRARDLLRLPVHLSVEEQDETARQTNDILAHCAFHFIAKYQFPIPIERDKPTVSQALDREWTEWAYLLKRLATKRRIPARVLYEGQIKQFVTTLENSIAVRQTITSRTDLSAQRQQRDDRYILQLISSGLQVARILQDSDAMEQLNQLYMHTEALIMERRNRLSSSRNSTAVGRTVRVPPGFVGSAVSGGNVRDGGGGGVGSSIGSAGY